MSFLDLQNKRFLVLGVANRKSVAYFIAEGLRKEGAEVIYAVRSEARRESVLKILPPGSRVHVCDVERDEEIAQLALAVKGPLDGMVHSVAFADFTDGKKPFHETPKAKFLQTVDISCFSLLALCNAFREHFQRQASVVTISISTTEMACENYGWMAPAKAALESSLVFLAKSFSHFSEVRFNAVCPGLLKTSASAGIPGYIDHYLYAEKCTLRRRAVETAEAANAALFLLSPASSGITGQRVIVDAGMRTNYFANATSPGVCPT